MTTSHCNLAFSIWHIVWFESCLGGQYLLSFQYIKKIPTKIGCLIVAIHMSLLSKPDLILIKKSVICTLILSFFKEIVFFSAFILFFSISLILWFSRVFLDNCVQTWGPYRWPWEAFYPVWSISNKTKQNKKLTLPEIVREVRFFFSCHLLNSSGRKYIKLFKTNHEVRRKNMLCGLRVERRKREGKGAKS